MMRELVRRFTAAFRGGASLASMALAWIAGTFVFDGNVISGSAVFAASILALFLAVK